jgi:hypothetical protein
MKSPAEPKRNNLTFRVRGDLRERLSNAAALAQRSISEEIEFRLERSFAEADVLARAFGGRTLADFVRALGIGLQIIQAKTGDAAIEESETSVEIAVMLAKIIRERLFYGNPVWSELLSDVERRDTGPGAEAAAIAISVLGASPRRPRRPLNV